MFAARHKAKRIHANRRRDEEPRRKGARLTTDGERRKSFLRYLFFGFLAFDCFDLHARCQTVPSSKVTLAASAFTKRSHNGQIGNFVEETFFMKRDGRSERGAAKPSVLHLFSFVAFWARPLARSRWLLARSGKR